MNLPVTDAGELGHPYAVGKHKNKPDEPILASLEISTAECGLSIAVQGLVWQLRLQIETQMLNLTKRILESC